MIKTLKLVKSLFDLLKFARQAYRSIKAVILARRMRKLDEHADKKIEESRDRAVKIEVEAAKKATPLSDERLRELHRRSKK